MYSEALQAEQVLHERSVVVVHATVWYSVEEQAGRQSAHTASLSAEHACLVICGHTLQLVHTRLLLAVG